MDWLDVFLEKCKNKIKNSSLRKSLVLYMLWAVVLTFVAVWITWLVCRSWQNVICQVNGIGEEYRYIGDGDFIIPSSGSSVYIMSKTEIAELNESDGKLYSVLGLIQILCIPIYSVGAMLLVSFIYYRNKLREPIFLLKKEMEAIQRNDLGFCCRYDSSDEMGEMCESMDGMRIAMVKNQQSVWEMMEEQRTINAAFAHDLRTPLTVINGYVEMLQEYYPKGAIKEEQLLSMLESIKTQTERMRVFSQTMKEVQGFEMLELKRKPHMVDELQRDIDNMVKGLQLQSGLEICVDISIEQPDLYYDEHVVMEVLGNLLSNALRYAKNKIQILVQQEENRLFLYVKDDGRGMTKEELYKADSPYYSDKSLSSNNTDGQADSESNMHFGLGLTICKILCKKHGGRISFANSVEGGAIICAEFSIG